MSTNTIILIGVIYSMFVSSILALIISFASDRVKQITFWTMGSLLGTSLPKRAGSLGRSGYLWGNHPALLARTQRLCRQRKQRP